MCFIDPRVEAHLFHPRSVSMQGPLLRQANMDLQKEKTCNMRLLDSRRQPFTSFLCFIC